MSEEKNGADRPIGFIVLVGMLIGMGIMVVGAAIDATMFHMIGGGCIGLYVGYEIGRALLKSQGWHLVRTNESGEAPPRE